MIDPAGAPGSAQGSLAIDTWEQPPRPLPGAIAAPVLAVDGFEGPLDWLLDLARTRKIDLARLSIAALVQAFEEALTAALAGKVMQAVVLGRWGDWLVMAAELTLLRSRLLVPADAAAARQAQDDAERLRRRLLDRAGVRRAADWLEARSQLGREVFARGQTDAKGTAGAARKGDLTALLRACLAAIRLPPDAGERFRVPGPPFWSVSDAAARIRAMLVLMGGEGAALEVFLPGVAADAPERELRCRVAVAATFLAGLELTREGGVVVQQETDWGSVQVRLGQRSTSHEAIA